MTEYIALLRAINISGRNKISMPELKKTFENKGFQNVSTYINSGNLFFSTRVDSNDGGNKKLAKECEQIITERFNLNIKVMVISLDEAAKALEKAPEWWGLCEDSIHNAVFVFPPMTSKELLKALGS